MAGISRLSFYNKVITNGIIPIFYNPDPDTAYAVAAACIEGGLDVVEITNRGTDAIDLFKKVRAALKKQKPQAVLGAGTVLDAATAAIYIARGADFIVSPVLDKETALLCNKHKTAYIPGTASLNEIHQAHSLGAELVKLFPAAECGGPAFVKKILAPCPRTSLIATGGVDPSYESLAEWFKAGITAAGIGSRLITKKVTTAGDYDRLKKDAGAALANYKKIKNSMQEKQ